MSQKTDDILEFLNVRYNKKETLQFAQLVLQENRIDDFMYCFFNCKSPIPERASWVITMMSDIDSSVFQPYVNKLVLLLQNEQHQSIERGVMRTLHSLPIPETSEGLLLDICFKWLLDPKKLVAAKVHAMENAFNLSIKHPELLDELEQIIHNEWDKHTVAFQARGRKILKQIKQSRIKG